MFMSYKGTQPGWDRQRESGRAATGLAAARWAELGPAKLDRRGGPISARADCRRGRRAWLGRRTRHASRPSGRKPGDMSSWVARSRLASASARTWDAAPLFSRKRYLPRSFRSTPMKSNWAGTITRPCSCPLLLVSKRPLPELELMGLQRPLHDTRSDNPTRR